MLHVLTYVVSFKLFWNWNKVVRVLSQEVWFDKGYVIWHFLNHCLLQILSSWSLSIGVQIIVNTNELVDRIRNFKSNASLLKRCHGGTRWAHGCGAQGTQVWVVDTRRGGRTPGWSLIKVYQTELNIRYARVRPIILYLSSCAHCLSNSHQWSQLEDGYIFSYRTHTLSHPPVFLIEWRTMHHLHALEVAESSEAQKHIT